MEQLKSAKVKVMRSYILARKVMFLCEEVQLARICSNLKKFDHAAILVKSNVDTFIRLAKDKKCEIVHVHENMTDQELNALCTTNSGSNLITTREAERLNAQYCVLVSFLSTREDIPYVLEAMIATLPKFFVISDSFFSENQPYLIYTDQREKVTIQKNSKPIALIAAGGYGDAIMSFRLIQAFINEHQEQGEQTVVLTWDLKMYKVLQFFLKDCTVIYFDITNRMAEKRFIECIFFSTRYKKCYQLADANFSYMTQVDEAFHFTDLIQKALNLQSTDQNMLLDSSILPTLPSDIISWLKERKQANKLLIGVQFKTDSIERSWPLHYAEEFIMLCQHQGYEVINLAPLDLKQQGYYDVSHLEVVELFSVINELDAVVGIDSCCGHIAGVLGKPNLTLWGNQKPDQVTLGHQSRKVSFRTLSMNYSLVPQDRNIATIKPSLVVECLQDILNQRILLKKEIITISDTLQQRWIENVGEC